jgi:acylphosphatase
MSRSSTTVTICRVIRRRVVAHGHVQGVFFRDSTRRAAVRAGVTGWVANRGDGSVEAVLEGEEDAVARVMAFMHDGPRGANVAWCDVDEEEPEGLEGFAVR